MAPTLPHPPGARRAARHAIDAIGGPRRTGTAGLVLTGASIACTIAVGVAGTSLMEPPLPGTPGQPPWSFDLRLSPYLAVGLAAAGLAAGTLGLALTLRALRAGWWVNPRAVLLAGVAAAIVAGTTRPFGSSDFLSYAAYGRELVTGHNPYTVGPAALARLGDPVARAVRDWASTPSVYGALASGVFGFASLVGGTSARLTVFALDLVNAAAFVATGLLLDRLTRDRSGRDRSGRDRSAARLRAAVLWTCNPLLLQILVAGGHVDALAVAFGVAGIAVAAPAVGGVSRVAGGVPRVAGAVPRVVLFRGVAAGALIGLGFAVKPTAVLIGIGIAIASLTPATSSPSAPSIFSVPSVSSVPLLPSVAPPSVRNTANMNRFRDLIAVSVAVATLVFRTYRSCAARMARIPLPHTRRGYPDKAELVITGCSPRYSRVTTRDHETVSCAGRRSAQAHPAKKGASGPHTPALLAWPGTRDGGNRLPEPHPSPSPETAKHQATETAIKLSRSRFLRAADRSRAVICGLLAGFVAVAAADFVLIGRAGIAQTLRASGMVSVGSPWRVVRTVLSQFMAESVADQAARACAIAFALCLAVALLRGHQRCAASPNADKSGVGVAGEQARDGEASAGRVRDGGALAGQAAFALVLAWLVAWPYVLPWYDALAWALLPLLPASWFDWALLARTAALGFGYLPARSAGIAIPPGLRWIEPVIRSAATPAVLAAVAVVLGSATLCHAWLARVYRE